MKALKFQPLVYLFRVTWDNHIMTAVIGAVLFTTFGIYYAHTQVMARTERRIRVVTETTTRRKTKPEEEKQREAFANDRGREVKRYDSLIHSHQLAY